MNTSFCAAKICFCKKYVFFYKYVYISNKQKTKITNMQKKRNEVYTQLSCVREK